MKRLILLAVVLAVGVLLAVGWRGQFDEQFAAASSRWTPLELRPIAWYKGDGNTTDSAGNYADGSWYGTATYTNGVGGDAFFVASNTSVATGILANDPALAGPFTITAWFNQSQLLGSSAAGDRVVSMARAEESMGRTGFGVADDGTFAFFLVNADNVAFECRGASVGLGTWRHGAMVWDGSVMRGYLDAAQSCAITNTLAAGSAVPVRIGAQTGTIRNFHGGISDVRIYDRALSQANIQRIMESQDNEPLEELQ